MMAQDTITWEVQGPHRALAPGMIMVMIIMTPHNRLSFTKVQIKIKCFANN